MIKEQYNNYSEAYNLEIGLLINFGEIILNFKSLTNKKCKTKPCFNNHFNHTNQTNHSSDNYQINHSSDIHLTVQPK
jgi:hypothetical protein